MAHGGAAAILSKARRLGRWLIEPRFLAFVPALLLGAFWLGGEAAMITAALGLPIALLVGGALSEGGGAARCAVDTATGLPSHERLAPEVTQILQTCAETGRASGLFLVQLEELDRILTRHGQAAADLMLERVGQRFLSILRSDDHIYAIGNGRFAICLAPEPHFSLESAIQLAARLQSSAEEPVSFEGQTLFSSASIGFCLSSRSPEAFGNTLLKAAETALVAALEAGPSVIRAYSRDVASKARLREQLAAEAETAFAAGAIAPFFQPQVSNDTGEVTGFEALARWQHPEKGLLSPAEFLPALTASGQMQQLGEIMLGGALSALKSWDAKGVHVPRVAVNFTAEELGNPKLAEKIRWDLDRFDLTPDRLTIEVLETIVAGARESTVSRNLARLSELGCHIDLDDFGTGYASITAIRRFAVSRIKIDRSFITRVDRDREQQRMVAAIQTMAERLGLETLAEGVETSGEHAMLAQLGCAHVQGFGIAHPMPADQAASWLVTHAAQLSELPRIQGESG